MQTLLDIIQHGKVKIELSVNEHRKCSVIFSVSDENDRRILKSAIMDGGKIKTYSNAHHALKDAIAKLTPRPEKSETCAQKPMNKCNPRK